jgi:hypothetical protein
LGLETSIYVWVCHRNGALDVEGLEVPTYVLGYDKLNPIQDLTNVLMDGEHFTLDVEAVSILASVAAAANRQHHSLEDRSIKCTDIIHHL